MVVFNGGSFSKGCSFSPGSFSHFWSSGFSTAFSSLRLTWIRSKCPPLLWLRGSFPNDSLLLCYHLGQGSHFPCSSSTTPSVSQVCHLQFWRIKNAWHACMITGSAHHDDPSLLFLVLKTECPFYLFHYWEDFWEFSFSNLNLSFTPCSPTPSTIKCLIGKDLCIGFLNPILRLASS